MTIAKTMLDTAGFDKSEKMMEIRNDLRVSANDGNFEHVVPFAQLGGLDESVMVFRLLTRHGYRVGSHSKGMMVKW